jgi:hypothetical protein
MPLAIYDAAAPAVWTAAGDIVGAWPLHTALRLADGRVVVSVPWRSVVLTIGR